MDADYSEQVLLLAHLIPQRHLNAGTKEPLQEALLPRRPVSNEVLSTAGSTTVGTSCTANPKQIGSDYQIVTIFLSHLLISKQPTTISCLFLCFYF